MLIMVNGGACLRGSNFILDWLLKNFEQVININKLTYAGNLQNLKTVEDNSQYVFIKEDILNQQKVSELINDYNPRYIINFAAESHVDRSINSPNLFIQTNIFGTYRLLESFRSFWNVKPYEEKNNFCFLYASTDEVYGSVNSTDSELGIVWNLNGLNPILSAKDDSGVELNHSEVFV